ncbi:HU domain-containing protein [Tellurirhabdus bombi]|uniref:HU domain-containing protein n=1 Tax=Tellurirhabdus bombi TaxID=2907205 RepID=UPI001F1FA07A|nr:SPOR domain-containing protein [Tellurirhabdus bombi]
MAPVSDYIKKLLYQYDCLVVAELGGFILHYLPASYAEKSGLYLPPRKRVAFNEALKLDDGLLINYMMLHEGQSRDEVLQRIRAFVDEVKAQTRQGGSVSLEGIGLFSENEEGRLQFEPELRHNFFGESYGFQPIAIELAEVNAPVELVDLSKGVRDAEEVETTEMPMVTYERPLHRTYIRWAAAVLLVGSLGITSYFTFSKVPGQLASSLNPFDLVWTFHAQPSVAASPEQPKGIDQPTAEKPAPVSEAVVVKPIRHESPEPEKVSLPALPEKAAVVKPQTPEFQFLAIAGSFSSKKNARKLQRQLRRKGFKTAYIVNPTAKGELYKVAAFGFNERPEAEASFKKVSKLTGTAAWASRLY